MAKIDLEKWICSMIECFPDFKESNKIPCMYRQALEDQGLMYRNGQIVEEIDSSNGGKKSSEDIPLGDSELIANVYTIPEGHTAEIKNGKVIIQKAKPLEIKAGQWYMCIRNFNDAFDNRVFTEGAMYKSTKNGTLIPDNSNCPYRICVPDHYFRPATKDEIPHEPKFKVGDFVVSDYCMGRVIELTKDAYLLDTEQSILFSYEHNARLWTIKDAKDGDVLVYGDNPNERHVTIVMLFKSWRDEDSSFNHFHIFDNEFRVNDWCDCGNNAHPATKEQRNLLFQKMKEAGYEWDAEKKELREIQKPDLDNTNGTNTIKFEQPKGELTEFEAAVLSLLSTQKEFEGLEEFECFLKEHSSKLLSLARKQIAEEIPVNHMWKNFSINLDDYVNIKDIYRKGILDTLKKIEGK